LKEDQSTFIAHAFSPSLGDQAVEGRITFDRWCLRFESDAITFDIPLTRLQIEYSESGNGQIIFGDSQKEGWSVNTFDPRILAHSSLLLQAHTRHQIKALRSRGELKRRLKITFVFLVAFGLIASVVSVLVGAMVRSLVQKVPVEWEAELGNALMTDLRDKETFVEDANLKAKLDQAVAPLLSALPRNSSDFRFYILRESKPNAFALPGGHVLVNTALIELADRPEEIAGVVAHELAHVTLKHGFRKIISSAGPYLVFKVFLGSKTGLLGLLGDSSQVLVRQSFSQEYELEADAVGWQYLVQARIDPRGLTNMLRKLKAEQESHQGMPPQIHAFSSHPPTEKRIQRLEDRWKKLKDKSGFIEFTPAARP